MSASRIHGSESCSQGVDQRTSSLATHVYLRITQGQCVMIDSTDLARVNKHRWYAVRHKFGYYAATNIKAKRVYMHRFLLGLAGGRDVLVDHINHDGLDNRRSNIRACTPRLNALNRRGYVHPRDGIGAVRCGGRWTASVRANGVRISLGGYETKEEAAIAYAAARRVVNVLCGVTDESA